MKAGIQHITTVFIINNLNNNIMFEILLQALRERQAMFIKGANLPIGLDDLIKCVEEAQLKESKKQSDKDTENFNSELIWHGIKPE